MNKFLTIVTLILPAIALAQSTGFINERRIVSVRREMSAESVARTYGIKPDFVYSHAFNGFAGRVDPARISALELDPRVISVERDQRIELPKTQETQALMDNPPARWGLDRIDQRSLPLDSSFHPSATGKGVTAYIIDSGIRRQHSEFEGRAEFGMDVGGGDASDCEGHGTHVSGTVAGKTYGVAPDAKLVAVAVFSCHGGGTLSAMIAGVDWVTAHRVLPAVANMSILTYPSEAFDAAVRGMIHSGVVTVVAAGNNSTDACQFSPGRVKEAITVGGTDHLDRRVGWMNFGPCVDIFAPGNLITSASLSSKDGSERRSGTSMASPHVTGAAALYLERHPTASPSEVERALKEAASPGKVQDARAPTADLLFVD